MTDSGLLIAVWQYFSDWQKALYAISSQPAIDRLVSTLNVPGAPKLTTNSLLAAIVLNYGINPIVDQAFLDILPSGAEAEPLDTSQTFMSTQLAGLLGDVLMSFSTNFLNGGWLWMAQDGQMMENTTVSWQNLESSFVGT